MSQSKYPEGTTFTQWFIAKEKSGPVIRRKIVFPTGKKTQERLSVFKYQQYKDSQRQLEDFVIRLNGKDPATERIKSKLLFRHAYISQEMMDEYRSILSSQVPSQKDANSLFQYLNKYALDFFIRKMSLNDPLQWHREQFTWGKYLLNRSSKEVVLDDGKLIFDPGEIKSAKVIRTTINELNKFMKFLHLKRPDEVAQLTFDPISRAAFKDHEARRKMQPGAHKAKYIPSGHWAKIKMGLEEKKAPWRFAVYLAYYYGLRRNEAMGLKLEDIKKGHLAVERQFDKAIAGRIEHKPLKNRLPRKVPHWFTEPADAHKYVTAMLESPLHPDTLSCYFSDFVAKLELPEYVFHDLRRSFITNAVKKKIEPEDLRLAAGHSNIQTTYKFYVMDSRELEDQIWMPLEEEEDVA